MILKLKKQFQLFLLTADIIIIYFSLFAAVYLRFGDFNYYDSYILDIRLIIIIGIYIIILYAMDGYNIDKVFKKNFFIIQYSTTFIMIGFAIASLIYMIPDIKYGRGIWLLQLLFSSALIIAWRYVFELMHAKISKRNLAVIGYNEAGIEIANIIDKTRYYSFSGFIYNRQIKAAGKNYRFLGATKDIINIINMNNISAIVLCDNNITDKKFEKNIIDVKMKGVDIYDVPMIFELIDNKIPISYVDDFWIIFKTFSGTTANIYNLNFKRFVDIVISLMALLLFSPVLLITAAAIKATSKGPIFYRQTRVGLDDETFQIIKFRSMIENAEAETGAVWASADDSRITVAGRVIRRMRIDELPQLFNVLRGDMSLVGPRPERPEYVEQLSKEIPYYHLRHVIKPGLSGWAQIRYRYGASVTDALKKLEYDLYYIRHLSFQFDASIIIQTIRTVLFGIGVR